MFQLVMNTSNLLGQICGFCCINCSKTSKAEKFSVCDDLKVGVILPLFKGKGAKANNKDNYRGITLFPTLCKI